MEFKRRKKCAIVGTAGTWKETPWNDPDLDIWTLNDAYMLGFPRIDVHFEQHPLDKFVYRKKEQRVVTHADIPPGHYLRPEGHLEWLKKAQENGCLVVTQDTPPEDWPKAMKYPREQMEQEFKDFLWVDKTWHKPYASSGPLWMMLLAIHMGYEDIGIYGIHLATEREYVEQRPNFEGIIFFFLGMSHMLKKMGKPGFNVHLPKKTPICKGNHVYCYDQRYSQEKDAIRHNINMVDKKRQQVSMAMMKRRLWQSKKPFMNQLLELEADRAELAGQLARVDFADQIERPEWRVT